MKAGIYGRISRDKTGAGLGVERQIEDCRALAAQHGWEIAAIFRDDDRSAYSGKPRPGYDALLAAITAGDVGVVLAWHQDRLLRRAADLERYIEACEPRGVATYTVKAGTIDLATPAGRAIARTLGAWASYEVETSTSRVRAAKLQQAKKGEWSGGVRPFGYTARCEAINEPEAAIYRELVTRVIASESFRSCALDLNRRGVKTSTGASWNALKVRNLLLRPRYAGLREHHGEVYPATWPAIIDLATYRQLQAAIKDHKALYKQRGPARKFLLTGFAFCGLCGNRMNTCPRTTGVSRYVCGRRNGFGDQAGCGKVLRMVAPVDQLITECILYRLDSADFAHQLDAAGGTNPELEALVAQHQAQQARIQEITDDYATGETDRDTYRRLSTAAQSHLEALGRQIDRLSTHSALSGLPVGKRAREAWEAGDLAWRRRIVSLLIEHVVINPSNVSGMKKAEHWNGWKFDASKIEIQWRC